MKLEIGMYVRINGFISKIDYIKKSKNGNEYVQFKEPNGMIAHINSKLIEKASHNITKLIKKNDIILGKDEKMYQVWRIYKDYIFTNTRNEEGIFVTLVDYQIDKILTKEQFEDNCYKVGE